MGESQRVDARGPRRPALAVVSLVVALGCGANQSRPTSPPSPSAATQPTPLPTATPIRLPPGMVCDPTPPPMLRIHVKIHSDDNGHIVLDSKPQVPNIDNYCDRVGFGSWQFCDTRPEGNEQRGACDYLAVGVSQDTGRWGPTWYYNDEVCGQSTRCHNHPTNQFMAVAKNSGKFFACAADDVPVATNGTRCGAIEIE